MISTPRSLLLLRNRLPLLTGLLILFCLPGCEEASSPDAASVVAQSGAAQSGAAQSDNTAQPELSEDIPGKGTGEQGSDAQAGDANDDSEQSVLGTGNAAETGSADVGSSNADYSDDAQQTSANDARSDQDSGDNSTDDASSNGSSDSNTSSGTNANANNSLTDPRGRNPRGIPGSSETPPETFVNIDPEQKKKELEAKRGKDGVYELTFDDIKFEMETGSKFERELIGDPIEGLSGKRIRIRGYIYPTTQQHPEQFILVRDNMECCFGPGAALYDCVAVIMNPGKQTTFTTRPVAVEGTFSVEVREFDGMVFSIYRLDADSAE